MSRRLLNFISSNKRPKTISVIPQHPYKSSAANFTPKSVSSTPVVSRTQLALMVVVVAGLGVASATGVSFIFGQNPHTAIAQSISSFLNPASDTTKPSSGLVSGPQPQLSQPSYAAEVKQSFITSKHNFIEVDLAAKELHYYQAGQSVFKAPIIAKGEVGTWWQTAPGVYQVEDKADPYFSKLGQVHLPWTLRFQSNFVIHGWPEAADGSARSGDYQGGGIRLQSDDAQALYKLVDEGTIVLVHDNLFTEDQFVYEPRVDKLSAQHYLLADIDNNTVLASSDLNATSSIASLTKLMTALVAIDQLALDTNIPLLHTNYPSTSVPRLQSRSQASLYSLLELLLLESSNEAAFAIASHLGREQFIAAMNEKAASLGLNNTQFTDSYGLDAGNVSTLADLYSLTQYIYQHQRFIFTLSREQATTSPMSNQFGSLQNFNSFGDSTSFIGGKVGQTLAAGETAITLYRVPIQNKDRTIVIIVLGSESRRQDTKQLYEYLTSRYLTTSDKELSF